MRIATIGAGAVLFVAGSAFGQVLDDFYAGCYEITDLGTPPGVPGPLGGINFMPGDPNTMLIGGSANRSDGSIYAIGVIRNAANSIVGFEGEAERIISTPYIDGGIAIGPGDVLFVTGYPVNVLMQILPGSSEPSRTDSLDDFGVWRSVGACQFVPEGFPGAGLLKIVSYSGWTWYSFTITPDGSGTFDLERDHDVEAEAWGGPEGVVYVGAGNPAFDVASILLSAYNSGEIYSYEVDANGDPIAETRRVFITGLSGAEGGVRDPLTGEYLFSTFGGGDRLIKVVGFNLDCAANFNRDCNVDFFDYLDFVQAFADEDPRADFNGDGQVDFFDYLDFVVAFSEGC